ncbi:MAG: nucleotidyltransferase [Deltaproteobacteria bacterium]|nr:nucleotidyltransferase [Deltaproteobacteria bacterium]
MRTVGLITEYNPFHNGHLHHLQESLRRAEADVSVAVMSGHFLQRGEPALVDKWVRAEMALSAGVDVVIELPLPWACSSAPDFARGGIQALNALGGIDALCFGSESGALEPLQHWADVLSSQELVIKEKTSQLLRQGVSYPQARARVLSGLLAFDLHVNELASPNNILGIEYLKAVFQTESSVQPLTIQRLGAGYHDTHVSEGQIASATGIRKRLRQGQAVQGFLPPAALHILEGALNNGQSSSDERYFLLLLSQILREPTGLDAYWLVENGIENRLRANADSAVDLEELISGIKSRQLTRTRVQRMLISILLGMKKTTVPKLLSSRPVYLHLLAVSERGRAFLARSRKQRNLPLIQNFSRVYPILKRYYGAASAEYQQSLQQLDLELRATRIYTLLQHKQAKRGRNRDFYQSLHQSK